MRVQIDKDLQKKVLLMGMAPGSKKQKKRKLKELIDKILRGKTNETKQ